MKNIIFILFVCAHFFVHSQVFYTENFSTGGAGWNLASVQGPEGADANFFKVSANEGGGITPNLGAPGSCGVANNGNNTMHITSVFNPNGGAAYDAGGLCGFLFCPQTNRRAESPTINCSGRTTISVNFNYIEGGQGTSDDATLWYFDGTIWAQIDNMPKTATGCGGQGLWVSRTIALPVSADNNANVKIGIRWVNNDDGVGSDPSFAVDDITLSTPVVSSAPVADFSTPSTTICAGQCINFTDLSTNSPTSWSWSFTGAAVTTSTLQNPTGICYNTPGTYTVALTATNGSGSNTNTKNNYITVLAVPVLTISPLNATLCAGSTQTLLASGATNYTWMPSAGLTSTNTAATTFTASTGNSYTVIGANGTCTSSATTSITVNALPTLTLTPNNPTICAGSTQTLLASGATNYTWMPLAGLTSSNTAATTFTANTGNSYTVIGANGTCTSSATTSITVNALPSLTIAPNNPTICAGSTQTLLASGATNYTWMPSAGLTSTNTAATTFTANTGNSYTVIGTNGTCTSSATTSITVNALPSLTITPNNPTICPGNTQTLIASGATNYSWNPATSLTSTNTANTTFTGNTTSSYTITGETGGCTSVTTTTITVGPSLVISITPFNATVCAGSTQTLQASGATNYTWSPSTNLSSVNTPTTTFTAGSSMIYTVTGTTGSCTGNGTVSITVVNVPTITATPSNVAVCSGNTQTLSVSGGTNYTWTPSTGLTSNSSATPTFTGNTSQNYIVTGSNGSCSSIATVSVTVNAPPTVNTTPHSFTMCEGSTVNFNASGAITYTWNPATALSSSTVSSPACNVNTTTNYTVTGTDANGCSDTALVNVFVDPAPAASFTYALPGVSAPVTIDFTNTTPGTNTYVWTFSGGSLSSTTTVTDPSQTFPAGTYTVVLIATNSNGCSNATQTIITFNDSSFVIMPNIFSPNGDGVNEKFKPILAGIETLSCTVYDRWGLKMHSFDKAEGFWDGRTTSGQECPEGTYFYVLEAKGFDGTSYKLKGNITLVR